MRIALVLPPLCQLNTPYPSIAYLARSLRDQGLTSEQHDLGLALMLRLFSPEGLRELFEQVAAQAERDGIPEPAWRVLGEADRHLAIIAPVLRFLQGKDRSLAQRMASGRYLPRGPRVAAAMAGERSGFGPMGVDDPARWLASLYLEDLADLVAATVDPGFGLARYQHHLAAGPVRYDDIQRRLDWTSLLDGWLDDLVDARILGQGDPPALACISVPFPGTLLAGLRIGRRLRQAGVHVAMGGGYVSTELREVDEPRLWDCVDSLVFDDGEGPLLALVEHLQGGPDRRHRTRTATGWRQAPAPSVPSCEAAWYGDLPLSDYLQIVDSTNPAHRLWSDGRWNKITIAHGCYWGRCAFCDTTLDYIARYGPAGIPALVDRMEELAEATGTTGFHLTDEAAAPRQLKALALELLARGHAWSFWGNVRFEAAFTPDLCRLLAAAGLVAVSGGLEVASDRLLKLMDKGVTIEGASRAAQAFQAAGVRVHAYLMYGFPTQTDQESVDAMELVRQLFAAGLLDSAFWHRFVLTRHSRVFAEPERFGLSYTLPRGVFSCNDIPHDDPTGGDHDALDEPLVRALEAWMGGRELDEPVQRWLPATLPPSREPRDRVTRSLADGHSAMSPRARLVWLGGDLLDCDGALLLHGREHAVEIPGSEDELEWLAEILEAARPGAEALSLAEAKAAFPGVWERFAERWQAVRDAGLVGV